MLVDLPLHGLEAGGRQLLRPSQLRLRSGAKHLLLGRNGCGKTTLLRAVAGGALEGWPASVTAHLLDQDARADPSMTALEAVLAADTGAQLLESEALALEEASLDASREFVEAAAVRLSEIYGRLEELGAEDEDTRRWRACWILQGLGFRPQDVHGSVGSLSGGWQRRVAFAAALFMSPQLLLLDEPTNHLDAPTIEWLQSFLANEYMGTVLCVTHDRAFADEVATEIVSFAEQQLEYFSGTLHDFEKKAFQLSKLYERQSAALESKREHVKAAAGNCEAAVAKRDRRQESNKASNKFGPLQGGGRSQGGRRSSQVAQRLHKLDRMGLDKTADGKRYRLNKHGARAGAAMEMSGTEGQWLQATMAAAPILQRGDQELAFQFAEPEPLGVLKDTPVLQLCDVSFRYEEDGEAVLNGVDLSVLTRSRIAVQGRNGAGKSTLIGLLVGDLEPTSGEVRRHGNLRIAYFSQHHAEELLHESATPLAHMCAALPKMKEDEALQQLEDFGVQGRVALQPLESLSGGQRMRVAFARICAEEPHVLVLDEPTNHLDIYSIDSLSDALRAFEGAVVLVSHDKRLVQDVAEEVVAMGDVGSVPDAPG